MMKAAVEFRAGRTGFGEQAVLAEQMNHRDAAEPAAEPPKKFPAVNQVRVFGAQLNRRLLRGADVAISLCHQSTNMNSEVLKMSRQTLAIPFCRANGTSLRNSNDVGRRSKAN